MAIIVGGGSERRARCSLSMPVDGEGVLVAEVFPLPGTDSFLVVRVYARPELLATFTLIGNSGGIPVPTSEDPKPMSGVGPVLVALITLF